MQSNYLVIEALNFYRGDRFPVAAGEKRIIRYGYENPNFVPKMVAQVRIGEQINWGGATVLSDGYRILFDGRGPLPDGFLA